MNEEEERLRTEAMLKKFRALRLYLLDQGYSEKDAYSSARYLDCLFPPLQERFDEWRETGELRDDLTVCGFTIGEISSRTEYTIPDVFLHFNNAFTVPWSETEEQSWSVVRGPQTKDFFRELGWKEEEEYFPSYEELVDWFETHEHNSRSNAQDSATEIINMMVRPLRERLSHWWLTGELKDDIEVLYWTLGRFLTTYVKGIPVALTQFSTLFKSGDGSKFWVWKVTNYAHDPALFAPFKYIENPGPRPEFFPNINIDCWWGSLPEEDKYDAKFSYLRWRDRVRRENEEARASFLKKCAGEVKMG